MKHAALFTAEMKISQNWSSAVVDKAVIDQELSNLNISSWYLEILLIRMVFLNYFFLHFFKIYIAHHAKSQYLFVLSSDTRSLSCSGGRVVQIYNVSCLKR